jgi:uncharacterized membrane-anchored protein YitT (DUF2179 family)
MSPARTARIKVLASSIFWNLGLITVGTIVFAVGMKTIALPQGFLATGVFGTSLLAEYLSGVSAGLWNIVLNVPLFIVGWLFVSRKFCLYSAYSVVLTSVVFDLVNFQLQIDNQLYAAVACGVICGIGIGIIFRSLGSNGGLDIVAIMLMQRYNIGIGKTFMVFNALLFSASTIFIDLDLIIVSTIMVFILSITAEQCLSLFNQRKAVLIISDRAQIIAGLVSRKLKQGGTILDGKGAYSGSSRSILLTIINNVQLKKLEEIVYSHDGDALMVVENTFAVLGASFSKRKIY